MYTLAPKVVAREKAANQSGKRASGIKNPENVQLSPNAKRPIPNAFDVQNAARLTRKRHPKLINRLKRRDRRKAVH